MLQTEVLRMIRNRHAELRQKAQPLESLLFQEARSPFQLSSVIHVMFVMNNSNA